jgi:F-type H+-transporting ATPase subunit a
MIKKRYIALFCVLLVFVFGTIISLTKPVLPFIQVPGEVYPGTQDLPVIGSIFGGITNTFMSSVVAYILILILIVSLRAKSRTADEVPTGFYNAFEGIIEGAYNFTERIAGSKAKDFFPYFMSIVLIILVTNWTALIPGWDSTGFWEYKPHFQAEKAAQIMEAEAEAAGEHISEEEMEAFVHEQEVFFDSLNDGDLNNGNVLLLSAVNANPDAPIETNSKGQKVGFNPEAADWTIVPFLRPGATDLNFTFAFALIAMVMVQYYGFKYLGGRDYLSKFFPFIQSGFGDEVVKNPILIMNIFVGLLELVSEFAKIISFGFRLFGNIFAGMVLLFVMSVLLSVANVAFYGLEIFVGLIQAAVFGLLTLIFMNSASLGHGDDH